MILVGAVWQDYDLVNDLRALRTPAALAYGVTIAPGDMLGRYLGIMGIEKLQAVPPKVCAPRRPGPLHAQQLPHPAARRVGSRHPLTAMDDVDVALIHVVDGGGRWRCLRQRRDHHRDPQAYESLDRTSGEP